MQPTISGHYFWRILQDATVSIGMSSRNTPHSTRLAGTTLDETEDSPDGDGRDGFHVEELPPPALGERRRLADASLMGPFQSFQSGIDGVVGGGAASVMSTGRSSIDGEGVGGGVASSSVRRMVSFSDLGLDSPKGVARARSVASSASGASLLHSGR
jgi:hypothetical protein